MLTACVRCHDGISNSPVAGYDIHNTAINRMGGQILARGYYHRILLPIDGLFQVNTARFKPEAPRAIDEVAGWVMICPASAIRVKIYSDIIYPRFFEKYLARQRAKAIRQLLLQYGVPYERLAVFVFGRKDPVAANNRLTGYALNRRIEITW